MTGLICTPSIIPAPTSATQPSIVNDGFLPDIDPDTIRDQVRIAPGITAGRLRAACVGAMLELAPDLASWIVEQRAAGHVTLGDVPAPSLDGKSTFELLYERAVGARAKAEIIERHRDVDQAGGSQRDSDDLDQSPDQLRRDATHAIRQILGRTSTVVELI